MGVVPYRDGMSITPDTKDWTWVLRRPCDECGFVAGAVAPEQVAHLVLDNAASWRRFLERSSSDGLTARPSDDRWSVLEYACHVRDVYGLFEERLRRMLDEDDPRFADWNQDDAAVSGRYREQVPAEVADAIEETAARLALRIGTVAPDAWQRPGTRDDGARFVVETFVRYMAHDVVHHLHDARRNLAMLGAEAGRR